MKGPLESRKKRNVKGLLLILTITSIFASFIGCSLDQTPSLVLYGATHYSVSDTKTSLLYIIDTDDGTGTLVGDTGFALSGLAFDRTTSKLYGTTSSNDATAPDSLIEINTSTGAGTLIEENTTGLWLNNPTVDSTGVMYAWTESSDDPVTIDIETGEPTIIGDSGLNTWTHGVFVDENDDLFIMNGDKVLSQIDTTTGAATTVADFSTALADYDYAHHGTYNFNTNEYWALTDTANSDEWPSQELLKIDIDGVALNDTMSIMDGILMIEFGYTE